MVYTTPGPSGPSLVASGTFVACRNKLATVAPPGGSLCNKGQAGAKGASTYIIQQRGLLMQGALSDGEAAKGPKWIIMPHSIMQPYGEWSAFVVGGGGGGGCSGGGEGLIVGCKGRGGRGGGLQDWQRFLD